MEVEGNKIELLEKCLPKNVELKKATGESKSTRFNWHLEMHEITFNPPS